MSSKPQTKPASFEMNHIIRRFSVKQSEVYERYMKIRKKKLNVYSMSSLRQWTIANDVIKLKQYTTINLLEYFFL